MLIFSYFKFLISLASSSSNASVERFKIQLTLYTQFTFQEKDQNDLIIQDQTLV